jgi:hypothetical protein
MGCNCKTSSSTPKLEENVKKERLINIILKYFAKSIGFLIAVALLPFIMVIIIWFMFDTIVLNKEVDLRIVLDKFIKHEKFFNSNYEDSDDDEEDEEDDDDFLSENDVVMLNVEDITKKSK